MDRLASDQIEYRRLAREFSEREIRTYVRASQDDHLLRHRLLEKLRALGLINVRIPEEYGGLGLKTFDACLIAEEFAAADSAIAASIEASEFASGILICFASAQQKNRLLKNLASTNGFAGLALESEINIAALTLNAVQSGEDFVLNGKCGAVINAHIADWILVTAGLSPGENSSAENVKNNWASFVVPLGTNTSLPGIKIATATKFLGTPAADIALVEFENVIVSKANRLEFSGNLGAFWQTASYQNFPIIASSCVGIARTAMHHAIHYAKERMAFGTPIANHQAVAFILANMAKDIETARELAWQAALAIDRGREDTILSYSCKTFAQEMVMNITTEAVQIMGAYGYCREYPTERLMRAAALYQLLCGNSYHLKGEIGKLLLS